MYFLYCKLHLLFVTMIIAHCAGSSCPTCSCLTDRLNLEAAMEGYDPALADPTKQPDPGFRGQIFEPWTHQVDGTVKKNPFISKFTNNHHCELDFVSLIIRDRTEYRNSKIAGYSFKKDEKYRKHFNFETFAGFGMLASDDLMDAHTFFLERRGEIVSSTSECITHTVEISSYVAPSFTQAFQEGLLSLHYAAKRPNSTESQNSYITFVASFGSHYLTKINLGAMLTFEKRFLTKSESPEDEEQRKSCVRASAEASIVPGVMCTASARAAFSNALHCCSKTSDDSGSGGHCPIQTDSNRSPTVKVISIGPWPTSGSKGWAHDTLMQSVPISFELASISSLFDNVRLDALLEDQQGGEEEQFNGTATRIFFEKMSSSKHCLLQLGETGKYGGVIIAGGWDTGHMRISSVESIGTWQPPSLPTALDALTLTVVNGVLYQCGGYLNSHRDTDSCYKLDLSSSDPIWNGAVALSFPMHYHTAVAIGSQMWFVFDNSISVYNTASNTRRISSTPFDVSRGHCAVANGTHSFVIGVGNGHDEVWINSEPTSPQEWRKVADLPVGRQYLACLWFENYIFVTGGHVDGNDVNNASIIDTVSNKVIQIEDLLERRRTHQMMVLEGKPAVLGGMINEVRVDSIETYDVVANRWLTHCSKLNTPRSSFGLVQFIRE